MTDLFLDEFEKYTVVYKALSEQTRLKIMWLLYKIESKASVSEIISVFEINQYNASKHLQILRNAGLVYKIKDGRWVFYQRTPINDEFLEKVYQSVISIPEPLLKIEIERCRCLLQVRENKNKSK